MNDLDKVKNHVSKLKAQLIDETKVWRARMAERERWVYLLIEAFRDPSSKQAEIVKGMIKDGFPIPYLVQAERDSGDLSCIVCRRLDLPLHTDYKCPNCSEVPEHENTKLKRTS